MTVQELIEELQKQNPYASIQLSIDGTAHTDVTVDEITVNQIGIQGQNIVEIRADVLDVC